MEESNPEYRRRLVKQVISETDRARDIIRPEEGKRHVIIIATGVNFIDISGADILVREAEKRRKNGAGLYFIRIKGADRSFLRKGDYLDKIGTENFFNSKSEALRSVIAKIDQNFVQGATWMFFLSVPNKNSRIKVSNNIEFTTPCCFNTTLVRC